MKTIPNLTFTIKARPIDADNARTADLLKLTLEQTPPGGFDFATMRIRNRIADACEKAPAGGEIQLEDADHVAAVECVRAYRWGGSHKDLLQFGEQFGL